MDRIVSTIRVTNFTFLCLYFLLIKSLNHDKPVPTYAEKEGCEDLIDSQILTAFLASLYVVYLLCGLYKASYTV